MLLDTSGLFCLLNHREPHHALAVEAYRKAKVRVTHGYVLAELVALGDARRLPAENVVSYLQDLLANPDIEVIWPDELLTAQALILLSSRLGAGYSLCDAVSFVVMRTRKFTDALTTDAHFQHEGFQQLLG